VGFVCFIKGSRLIIVFMGNKMNFLLQMMGDFIQVEALENLVQSLKKKVCHQQKQIENEKGSASNLGTTRSALDRAALALAEAQPKRKLTLEQIEVKHLVGEGGWGSVWKVSVMT
jgi:hypothetical protein